MKLKLIAAAALVVSVGAHADMTFNLGTVSGTVPIADAVTGLFTDTFNFDTTGSSTATAIAVNTSYFVVPPGVTLGNIAGFSGTLDGNSLTWSSSTTPIAPGIDQIMQTLMISSLPLAAGPHSLVIMGTADSGSAYTGSISVVPEPETYALMLAGLGAIGFLARRRQQH